MPKGEGIWTYFECKNLYSYVAQLLQKGIEFTQMPKDMPWLWREAWLYDLDGNKLILCDAEENRLNPPWRIGKVE